VNKAVVERFYKVSQRLEVLFVQTKELKRGRRVFGRDDRVWKSP